MHCPALATGGPLTAFVTQHAQPVVARSVVALLGPSVGYFLAPSDICG
jgi:hypothetical protein